MSAAGYAPWTIVRRGDGKVIGWGGLHDDPFEPSCPACHTGPRERHCSLQPGRPRMEGPKPLSPADFGFVK